MITKRKMELDERFDLPGVIDTTNGPLKRILVVDDDCDMTDVLSAILEGQGYVVETKNRGIDALHALLENDFDAILCDMVMPEVAGDKLFYAVGKLRPHLGDRFIFITGHGGNPQVAAFLFRAERPVIYKPVLMDDLLSVLFRMLFPQEAQA